MTKAQRKRHRLAVIRVLSDLSRARFDDHTPLEHELRELEKETER